MEQLTIFELSELEQCETIIENGLRTFVDVGGALLKIRDERLYRQEYGTFQEYCQNKWNMSRIHAHRMIEAANIANNLLPIGNILPSNEAQARPLTKLDPEEQREVWAEVIKTAPPSGITGAFVQEIVERKTQPHVLHNSGENEWYTPPEFIEAARATMGSIDVDPASSEIANEIVQAETFYDIDNNGLVYKWRGNVWLNPPYSQPQVSDFTKAVVGKYLDGEISQACVLVNNATETEFFQRMLTYCAAVCFPKSRIKYLDETGNPKHTPLQGQAILYFGANLDLFVSNFGVFGKVLYVR